jgi:glycosyltransferase involved in cell wall biosynthesis
MKLCAVIPTYNNEKTLAQVIASVMEQALPIIVVNDGSTDGTDEKLKDFEGKITVVSYKKNRGKGYALRCGFDKARALGFEYALTIDADGQHYASDIPLFMGELRKNPNAMMIGSRLLKQKNMPEKNTFANKFSNFWFAVQTGIKLPDTQTGFRLYPLLRMKGMRPFTSRYEAELELLVRAAWRNIPLISIPINVYYPDKSERVTHFRPSIDFLRISLLNTLFVFGAIFYGYPSIFFRRVLPRKRLPRIH